jgi:hypothetical protein
MKHTITKCITSHEVKSSNAIDVLEYMFHRMKDEFMQKFYPQISTDQGMYRITLDFYEDIYEHFSGSTYKQQVLNQVLQNIHNAQQMEDCLSEKMSRRERNKHLMRIKGLETAKEIVRRMIDDDSTRDFKTVE